MMTKKDYIRASDLISNVSRTQSEATVRTLVTTFTTFFREDNPRFDVKRFHDACMVEVSR